MAEVYVASGPNIHAYLHHPAPICGKANWHIMTEVMEPGELWWIMEARPPGG